MVYVNLSEIRPMIAMPFHPANTYTIEELNKNLMDILDEVEKKAKISLGENVFLYLKGQSKKRKTICRTGDYLQAVQEADLKIFVMRQIF